MASTKVRLLTQEDLVELSMAIAKDEMKLIALSSLEVDIETLDNLDAKHSDPRVFNTAVLVHWHKKQTGWTARKDLAAILYRAASKHSFVDPRKVREILGISQEEAEAPEESIDETFEKAETDLNKHIKKKSLKMFKPEMAPWSRDATTKMADVDIRLHDVRPGRNQRKRRKVELDYRQLFQGHSQGQKVLVTGRHGSGKTLLSKKIGYDWANDEFKQFPFVFVLLLEELGSGKSLVQAVVDQYNLKDQHKDTLADFLSDAAHLCLFILDGVGSEFLLKSVSYRTNILVTTLLTTDTISAYNLSVPVFELASLYKVDARKLVSDKTKSKAILNSLSQIQSPLTSSGGYNPMLVMFMSVLESREPGRLFGSRNLTLCDIYLQLVSTLCQLNVEDLCEKMKSVGRVVFDYLQSGKELPHKGSEIEFLRENDLVVPGSSGRLAFAHDTLGVFLGALYFTLQLSDGINLDDLPAADSTTTLILSNPLFLYFCLSLLKQKKHPKVDKKKKKGYKKLKKLVKKKLNLAQIDLRDIFELYPALKCTADSDDIVVEFLSDVLSKCSHAKVLFLNHELPAIKILDEMGPSVFKLKSLVCLNPGELLESEVHNNDTELHVIVQNQAPALQKKLLDFLKDSGERFSLVFIAGNLTPPMVKFSTFTQGKITQLKIMKSKSDYACPLYLEIENDFEVCNDLTHLTLVSHKLHLMNEPFQALADAAKEGKLPILRSLNFRKLDSMSCRKMGILFQTPLPKLTELDLWSCSLSDNDKEVVLEKTLPRLSCLRIIDSKLSKIPESERNPLKTLKLEGVGSRETSILSAVCDGKFPELTSLKLSGSSLDQEKLKTLGTSLNKLGLESLSLHSCSSYDVDVFLKEPFIRQLVYLDLNGTEIAGKEPHLFYSQFPVLESLNLGGCGICVAGMRILAQANNRGNFPKLRHLELRGKGNSDSSQIKRLSSHESKWPQLKSFSCDWTNPNKYNSPHFGELLSLVESGCLGFLETLTFYDDGRNTEVEVLESVVENLEVFSALKELYIHTRNSKTNPAELRQKIRSHNISLHLIPEYW